MEYVHWVARWKRRDTTSPWQLSDRKYRGPYSTPQDAQRSAGLCDSFNNPSEFHVSYSNFDPIPPPPGDQGAEYLIPTDPAKIRADLNHMLNPVIGQLRLLERDLVEDRRLTAPDQVQHWHSRLLAALTVAEEQLGFSRPDELADIRAQYGMGS